MAKLQEYQTFITVVELQSLAKTARALNLSPSAVSKHLAGLEEDLGVKLIDRSTRSLAVTDLGERFYLDCCFILQQVRSAEDKLKQARDRPFGKLNLSLPRVLMNPGFVRLMRRFTQSYPEIHLDFSVSDEMEDLVNGSIDFAFRIGDLDDSRLTARKVMDTKPLLCAAPEFIAEHPQLDPGNPSEAFIRQHLLIPTYLNLSTKSRRLTGSKGAVDLAENHTTDDAVGLYQMVKQGLGCAFVLDLMVREDILSGALVELRPKFELPLQPLFLVFHKRDYQPKKMQVFSEFILHSKTLGLS